MSDLLEEFEQKKEVSREIVEEHVSKRDNASTEAHEYAQLRDELNTKVREMRDDVKRKIAEKNELIEKVQNMRADKEEHYRKLSELRKEMRKIRDEANIQGIDRRDIKARKKDLERLELKQQTTQLKKNEELKVVAEIKKLTNEIKRMEKQFETELEGNSSIRDLNGKINEEKKLGESEKKEIEEISSKIFLTLS